MFETDHIRYLRDAEFLLTQDLACSFEPECIDYLFWRKACDLFDLTGKMTTAQVKLL